MTSATASEAHLELTSALRRFGQRAAVRLLLQAVWFLFLVRMPIQMARLASHEVPTWLRTVSESPWLFIGWPVVTELLRGGAPARVGDAEDRRRALCEHRLGRSRLAMIWGIPVLYGGFLLVNFAALAMGRGGHLVYGGLAPGVVLLLGAFLFPPLLGLVDLARGSLPLSLRVRVVEADDRSVLVELSSGEQRLLDARSLSGSAARGLRGGDRVWLSGARRSAPDGAPPSSPYREQEVAWTDARVETLAGRVRRLREALAHVIDLAGYAVAPVVWGLGGVALFCGNP